MHILWFIGAFLNTWLATEGLLNGWPTWVVALNIVIAMLSTGLAVKESP